jgi:hypothetical protein
MSETDEIDLLEETEAIERPTIQKKKTAFVNPAPKVVLKKRGSAPARQHKKEIESDEEGGSEPLGSDEEEEEIVAPVKVKKERTQKQKDAFERCILKKKECASKRNDDAKRLAAFEKAALEEKVVKKAISIKKKQIKKQSALDEISDDDTPIEKVKALAIDREIAKKIPVKQIEKPKPTFNFI